MKPNSLGFCETQILSQTYQKPSLQNFIDCFQGFVFSKFASTLPQKCGCEINGEQYCMFDECNSGSCANCLYFGSVDGCDNVGLSYAGASDCKLRCFNVFEISPQQIDEQCGRYDIESILSEIPENERLKFCNLFYPFTSNKVSPYERNDCYQKMGIQVDRGVIYEQCSTFLWQFESLDLDGSLEDYKNCLVRQGLATQPKADACNMQDGIVSFNYEILQIIDQDRKYSDCLVNGFNQTLSAEFCFKNEFQFSTNGAFPDMETCLESFGLPMTDENKCFYDKYPKFSYNIWISEFTVDFNGFFTADECDSNFNKNCEFCKNLVITNLEYFLLVQKAQKTGSGRQMDETLDHILRMNPQCKKIDGIFDEYDSCMANIHQTDMIDILNENLKQKKERLGEIHEPITTESDFCEKMFPNKNETDSKITCYDKLVQPLGPQKCLDYQRVTDNNTYEFNLFYKYFCMSSEGVILDQVSQSCITRERLIMKRFKQIEDCLIEYESSGHQPHLILERSQYFYIRSTEEHEHFEGKKEDRDTDFTIDQIEQFLCQNMTTLNFYSSPFSVRKENQLFKVNELGIKLDCSVFKFENATRDNLMVHYKFTNLTVPQKTNPEINELGLDLYTKVFNTSALTVNKTDLNEQYFEIQFSEDLDLIQVLNYRLYHHENRQSVDEDQFQKRKEYKLLNYTDFLNFTSDPITLKIFETYPQVISQELMVDTRIMAESFKQIEYKANVTKQILGFLPYEYKDYEYHKIQVKKISDVVKPIQKNELIRDEMKRINFFKVILVLDFQETVVTTKYYTTLDIFSELGGLSASVGRLLAQFAVVFLMFYNYQLSSLIKRKYGHILKLQEIKQYLKLMPKIQEVVRAKLRQTEIDQESQNTGDHKIDYQKIKIQLSEDLEIVQIVQVEDYQHQYELTERRHEILEELIERHLPDMMDPSARFQLQREVNKEDEFELIEIDENEAKHQMHVSNASLPVGDILSALRERISFYGVYKQVDNVQSNKIMIKKLKYQIKLEREKREKVQGEVERVQEEVKKFKETEKDSQNFEGEVEKLKAQIKQEQDERKKIEDQLKEERVIREEERVIREQREREERIDRETKEKGERKEREKKDTIERKLRNMFQKQEREKREKVEGLVQELLQRIENLEKDKVE